MRVAGSKFVYLGEAMSTRSTITAKFSDGKYRSVYCHFDGYIDGVGKTLANHYNTQTSIESLISNGGISVLRQTIEDTEFYARDRGEEIEIAVDPTLRVVKRQEYNYFWDGEEWMVNGGSLSIALVDFGGKD